jgi:predicted MFS family arabinose efflux permease
MIFALLPLLLGTAAEAMNLDDARVGFLASAYVGGYTVVTALSFFWITRIGWRYVFAMGILLLVAGLLSALVAANYMGVMAGLVIAGLGAGFMYALSVAIISEMQDADRKFGIKMVPEQGISAVLLFLVPALVIAHWGLSGLLVTLVAVFILALPFLAWIPPHGNKHGELTAGGPMTVPPALVFLALLGLLLFFGGIAGIWAFMERFASEGDIDQALAGQLLAVGVVSSAVGPVIPAIIGDRFGRTVPLMVASAIVVLSLLILATPLALWKYGLILVVLPAAWYAGMAYQMGIIADADVTGRYSVLMSAALGIGATLGPALLGVIKSGSGLGFALGFAGVVSVAGALVSLWVVRRLDTSDTPLSPVENIHPAER